MFLETGLTILNIAEKATKIYDWFTGITAGEKMDTTVKSLSKSKSEVRRLSDRVLYAPNFQQAINITGNKVFNDDRKIHDMLNPVAEALDTDLLAGTVITTPEKLKKAFKKDPWELLIEVRPASRTKKPSNPDLIPITFSDNNIQYIGWQTRGALPSLFNIDFEHTGNTIVPENPGRGLLPELVDWFHANEPKDDYYVDGNIPVILMSNAKSKFKSGHSDTILALIDCTVGKSAKDFLAFGLKGISYNNAWSGNQSGFHFISYEDFRNRTFSYPWLFEISFDKGGSLDCSGCSTPRKDIVTILNGVKEIVEKYF